MKKNLLITFFCALIPGFGQMYQGYMKRGISLTLWFTIFPVTAFILNEFLSAGFVLAFFMIAIWAFSFFDTFNIRNMSPQQREQLKDDTLPGAEFFEGIISKSKNKSKNNLSAKIAGWALIVIGALVFFSGMNRGLSRIFGDLFQVSYSYIRDVFSNILSVAIGVVVIVVGVKMLKRNMKKDANNEEIPPFKSSEAQGGNSSSASYNSHYQSPFQSGNSGSSETAAQGSTEIRPEQPADIAEETGLSNELVEKVDEKDIILEIKPGNEEEEKENEQ